MPDEDVAAIKKMGVREVLLQDTPPQAIVDKLNRLVQERGPRLGNWHANGTVVVSAALRRSLLPRRR
jgi:hypothetical protein